MSADERRRKKEGKGNRRKWEHGPAKTAKRRAHRGEENGRNRAIQRICEADGYDLRRGEGEGKGRKSCEALWRRFTRDCEDGSKTSGSRWHTVTTWFTIPPLLRREDYGKSPWEGATNRGCSRRGWSGDKGPYTVGLGFQMDGFHRGERGRERVDIGENQWRLSLFLLLHLSMLIRFANERGEMEEGRKGENGSPSHTFLQTPHCFTLARRGSNRVPFSLSL